MNEAIEPAAVSAPQRSAAAPTMTVVTVRDRDGLLEHVAAWEALAGAASEPNAFYEPWMLLPALEAFGAGLDLVFVLIYRDDPANPGARTLCGFFPLERHGRYKGLPIPVLQLWSHKHCFLCTPLVHHKWAAEALARFFDWLASERSEPLLSLDKISGDGPFYRVLVDYLYRRDPLWYDGGCYTRALLRRGAGGEEYLRANLSGDRRRNLKRKERRLADTAPVEYSALEPGADAADWIKSFLDVEASGWKGRQGSALACEPRGRLFFETIAGEAARRNRLLFYRMRLGAETIALSCYFRAGAAAFWFKPAFDERFAKFSPGLLLKTEITRRLHEVPGLEWVDSCTAASTTTLDGLWADRRIIASLTMSTGRAFGNLSVSLLPILRWARRSVRRPPKATDGDDAPNGE